MSAVPPSLPPRRPEVEVLILRGLFEGALDAIVTMDQSGAITGWNRRAEVIFGWTAREAIGRTLSETIIPPQHRQAHDQGLATYLFTGVGPVLGKVLDHLTAVHRDGHEFPVELAISEAWQANNQDVVFGAFIRDISERKASERVRVARFAVTRTLAANHRWVEAAPAVLEGLCTALEWDVAGAYDIRPASERAEYQTGWAAPGLEGATFVRASQDAVFVQGVGLPGRVWAQGKAATIPDLAVDSNFPRRAAAEEAGLVSAAAFPILEDGVVTGIVELFSTRRVVLEAFAKEVLDDIGSQLGQFRVRERFESSAAGLGGSRESDPSAS